MFYSSILLTILANIGYHLSQKGTPQGIHPLFSLTITYATALVLCLAAMPWVGINASAEWKNLNWASFALGGAIVALELGFLLAYRAGWTLSLAAIYSNTAVTLLLLPLGVAFFGDKLSMTNLVGVALATVGLLLMSGR